MRKALNNEEAVLSWLAARQGDDLYWEEPIQMASIPLIRLIPPALAFCSLHTEIWMLLHLVTFSTLQIALPVLHRDSLCVQQQGMTAPPPPQNPCASRGAMPIPGAGTAAPHQRELT